MKNQRIMPFSPEHHQNQQKQQNQQQQQDQQQDQQQQQKRRTRLEIDNSRFSLFNDTDDDNDSFDPCNSFAGNKVTNPEDETDHELGVDVDRFKHFKYYKSNQMSDLTRPCHNNQSTKHTKKNNQNCHSNINTLFVEDFSDHNDDDDTVDITLQNRQQQAFPTRHSRRRSYQQIDCETPQSNMTTLMFHRANNDGSCTTSGDKVSKQQKLTDLHAPIVLSMKLHRKKVGPKSTMTNSSQRPAPCNRSESFSSSHDEDADIDDEEYNSQKGCNEKEYDSDSTSEIIMRIRRQPSQKKVLKCPKGGERRASVYLSSQALMRPLPQFCDSEGLQYNHHDIQKTNVHQQGADSLVPAPTNTSEARNEDVFYDDIDEIASDPIIDSIDDSSVDTTKLTEMIRQKPTSKQQDVNDSKNVLTTGATEDVNFLSDTLPTNVIDSITSTSQKFDTGCPCDNLETLNPKDNLFDDANHSTDIFVLPDQESSDDDDGINDTDDDKTHVQERQHFRVTVQNSENNTSSRSATSLSNDKKENNKLKSDSQFTNSSSSRVRRFTPPPPLSFPNKMYLRNSEPPLRQLSNNHGQGQQQILSRKAANHQKINMTMTQNNDFENITSVSESQLANDAFFFSKSTNDHSNDLEQYLLIGKDTNEHKVQSDYFNTRTFSTRKGERLLSQTTTDYNNLTSQFDCYDVGVRRKRFAINLSVSYKSSLGQKPQNQRQGFYETSQRKHQGTSLNDEYPCNKPLQLYRTINDEDSIENFSDDDVCIIDQVHNVGTPSQIYDPSNLISPQILNPGYHIGNNTLGDVISQPNQACQFHESTIVDDGNHIEKNLYLAVTNNATTHKPTATFDPCLSDQQIGATHPIVTEYIGGDRNFMSTDTSGVKSQNTLLTIAAPSVANNLRANVCINNNISYENTIQNSSTSRTDEKTSSTFPSTSGTSNGQHRRRIRNASFNPANACGIVLRRKVHSQHGITTTDQSKVAVLPAIVVPIEKNYDVVTIPSQSTTNSIHGNPSNSESHVENIIEPAENSFDEPTSKISPRSTTTRKTRNGTNPTTGLLASVTKAKLLSVTNIIQNGPRNDLIGGSGVGVGCIQLVNQAKNKSSFSSSKKTRSAALATENPLLTSATSSRPNNQRKSPSNYDQVNQQYQKQTLKATKTTASSSIKKKETNATPKKSKVKNKKRKATTTTYRKKKQVKRGTPSRKGQKNIDKKNHFTNNRYKQRHVSSSTWAGNTDDPNLHHVGGAEISF